MASEKAADLNAAILDDTLPQSGYDQLNIREKYATVVIGTGLSLLQRSVLTDRYGRDADLSGEIASVNVRCS